MSNSTIEGDDYMCAEKDKIDLSTKEQDLCSTIIFTKSQQWNMANYSLLMQGAIIGAFELLWNVTDCKLQWMRIPFAALAIFASIWISVYTNRLFKVYKANLDKYQGISDKFTTREPDNYSDSLHDIFNNYPEIQDEFYERLDAGIKNTNLIIRLLQRIPLYGTIFSIFYFCFKLSIYFAWGR